MYVCKYLEPSESHLLAYRSVVKFITAIVTQDHLVAKSAFHSPHNRWKQMLR